jgi:hypothetical protein
MSSIMDRIISVVRRRSRKNLDQLTPTEFQVLKPSARANPTTRSLDALHQKTPFAPYQSIYASTIPTAACSGPLRHQFRALLNSEERIMATMKKSPLRKAAPADAPTI